jgi:hypothetical protein
MENLHFTLIESADLIYLPDQARTEGGGPMGPRPPLSQENPWRGVQVDNFRAA